MSHSVRAKTQRIRCSTVGFQTGDPDELWRTRATRRVVQRAATSARRRAAGPAPCLPPEAVPIEVRDRGPYVHYPASAADLAAVLRAMPAGVADGLGGVELDVAPSYTLCATDASEDELDGSCEPFTGRRGFATTLDGVYSRRVLGLYRPRDATIRVYGYLYDPARADRDLLELVLRVQMLATFVHELAHHHDHVCRAASGRWMPRDTDKAERYAEARGDVWTRDVVVPYVLRTYPEQVALLDAWMLHHGGVSLPLDLLVASRSNGSICSARAAFELLHDAVARGRELASTRRSFAFWLHYDYHFDEALVALERLLADAPDDTGALTLRSHIHVHQGRHQEAIDAMLALVERLPNEAAAWRVLEWAYAEAQDASASRDARARAEALGPAKRSGSDAAEPSTTEA